MTTFLTFLGHYLIGILLSACATTVIACIFIAGSAVKHLARDSRYNRALWGSLVLGMGAMLAAAFLVMGAYWFASQTNYEGLLGIVAGAVFPGIVLLVANPQLQTILLRKFHPDSGAA